ncbi:hypothetical protein BC629DRAFT_1547604 [Irpex lacteus]|nr:hypothetical protein BC629DRAFT_1547604 [Irpex lacteus]
METSAAKVTYLVEWPGYSSMRKQMNARRLGGLQSRSRIAKQIVEVMEEFIEERCNYNTTETQWRVGPGFIELGSLHLMELRRISKATWLVVLACNF